MRIQDERAFRHVISFFKCRPLLSYWSYVGLKWYEKQDHVSDLAYICEILGFVLPKKNSHKWLVPRLVVVGAGLLWMGACLGIGGIVLAVKGTDIIISYNGYPPLYGAVLSIILILFGFGIIATVFAYLFIEYLEYVKMWKFRDSKLKEEQER